MESILTLVAPPDCKLETSVSEIAVTALGVGGAHSVDGVEFFSNDRAADIRWEGDPWNEHIADAVRLAIGHKPIDYALQPAKHRGKRLMIADMDSTIVASETLDEMAARAGFGHRVSEITSRAMNGEIDFQTALRERIHLLAGVEAGILEDYAHYRVLTERIKVGLFKLEEIKQSMDGLKQQYDEIDENGQVVNSYVLPRPVDEMKEEMAGFIQRSREEIEIISDKRNTLFDRIKEKNYEHIL